jgi:hypothetical protein
MRSLSVDGIFPPGLSALQDHPNADVGAECSVRLSIYEVSE